MIVIDKDVMVAMTDGVRLALIRKSSGEPGGPVEPLISTSTTVRPCFGMKRSTADLSCGLVSLRSPLFPTRYLALAGGLMRRIDRRRTSVRRPAERVDRNGALDRHDWLSACRSA
jgi:hypothetical protein